MTYDQITLELKNVINKEKGKVYSTFETRVVDMASDCLKFIEENESATKEISTFKWVDIEDRLPSTGEWVLAAVKCMLDNTYEVPIILQFQDGDWCSRDSGYILPELFLIFKITHWSPLPKNPEVKK